MKAGLNKIKIAIISMIVLAMAIGQLELFGKVYAEELEKQLISHETFSKALNDCIDLIKRRLA